MPPLIFDFPSIAQRLRKDDFFTPTPKEAPTGAVPLEDPGHSHAQPVLSLQCPYCASFKTHKGKYDWHCGNCANIF